MTKRNRPGRWLPHDATADIPIDFLIS